MVVMASRIVEVQVSVVTSDSVVSPGAVVRSSAVEASVWTVLRLSTVVPDEEASVNRWANNSRHIQRHK